MGQDFLDLYYNHNCVACFYVYAFFHKNSFDFSTDTSSGRDTLAERLTSIPSSGSSSNSIGPFWIGDQIFVLSHLRFCYFSGSLNNSVDYRYCLFEKSWPILYSDYLKWVKTSRTYRICIWSWYTKKLPRYIYFPIMCYFKGRVWA